jgi:hypothetical protein
LNRPWPAPPPPFPPRPFRPRRPPSVPPLPRAYLRTGIRLPPWFRAGSTLLQQPGNNAAPRGTAEFVARRRKDSVGLAFATEATFGGRVQPREAPSASRDHPRAPKAGSRAVRARRQCGTPCSSHYGASVPYPGQRTQFDGAPGLSSRPVPKRPSLWHDRPPSREVPEAQRRRARTCGHVNCFPVPRDGRNRPEAAVD